jgi:hypothetical protein
MLWLVLHQGWVHDDSAKISHRQPTGGSDCRRTSVFAVEPTARPDRKNATCDGVVWLPSFALMTVGLPSMSRYATQLHMDLRAIQSCTRCKTLRQSQNASDGNMNAPIYRTVICRAAVQCLPHL